MNNYAIVADGIVENIVAWNGDMSVWQPPEGSIAVPLSPADAISISYTYDGTKFSPPA